MATLLESRDIEKTVHIGPSTSCQNQYIILKSLQEGSVEVHHSMRGCHATTNRVLKFTLNRDLGDMANGRCEHGSYYAPS